MGAAQGTEANGLRNMVPKGNLATTTGQAEKTWHPTASATASRARDPRPAALEKVLGVTSAFRERLHSSQQGGPSRPS